MDKFVSVSPLLLKESSPISMLIVVALSFSNYVIPRVDALDLLSVRCARCVCVCERERERER